LTIDRSHENKTIPIEWVGRLSKSHKMIGYVDDNIKSPGEGVTGGCVSNVVLVAICKSNRPA
jgi:hypothetical protein